MHDSVHVGTCGALHGMGHSGYSQTRMQLLPARSGATAQRGRQGSTLSSGLLVLSQGDRLPCPLELIRPGEGGMQVCELPMGPWQGNPAQIIFGLLTTIG